MFCLVRHRASDMVVELLLLRMILILMLLICSLAKHPRGYLKMQLVLALYAQREELRDALCTRVYVGYECGHA